MAPHVLNNTWVLWFHSPLDNDWSIDSYKEICEINTIEEFWGLSDELDEKLICNCMFFLMRKGIKPIWEDKENCDGGCWSFKITKKDIYKAWNELSIALLGETVTLSKDKAEGITGISLSPKKAFSIIKIWNKNSKENKVDLLSKKIPFIFLNSSIYKAHNEKK